MKKLHILLTLSSLNVILVSIERYSFTTKIILQPYNFLRLHEVFQIVTLILFTVIIPFLSLQIVSDNFKVLQARKGIWLGVAFIVGVYFYATGNGIHELGSFLFNTFCPQQNFSTRECNSMFFNDYYFGNILYFLGALFMTTVLLICEHRKPQFILDRRDQVLLFLNALFYALAIFAYSGFDRVLVGLVFSIMQLGIIVLFVIRSNISLRRLPFTFYGLCAYLLGTIPSIIIRIMHK